MFAQPFSKVSGTLSAADGETRVNIEAEVNGHRLTATAAQFKGALHLHLADAALSGRHMHVFDLVQPSVSGDDAAGAASGISAEMPGKIVKFLVDAGAFVNKVRVCSVAAARECPRTDRPLLTTLRAPHLSDDCILFYFVHPFFFFQGDPVVVLEAMKMEHTLCAPFAGTVGDIFAASGDFVDANVDIVVLSKEEEEA